MYSTIIKLKKIFKNLKIQNFKDFACGEKWQGCGLGCMGVWVSQTGQLWEVSVEGLTEGD